MDFGNGFPVDLILFGMIAAFLVLRLRSILGKRTGYERPPQAYKPSAPAPAGPVIDGRAEPPAAAATQPGRALPDPASPAGQALARMQRLPGGFDPASFLAGAEQAFRMIVEAFARGDRDTLRNLLADDTYRAFEGAITAREAAGQKQATEIRAIPSATIEAATLLDQLATITVRFVSDQVSVTTNADGTPAAGADAVTEITDIWTFERAMSSRDPTWRLVAARSA
jgi:predicted lipid-binding transport protein (Tim44 family)